MKGIYTAKGILKATGQKTGDEISSDDIGVRAFNKLVDAGKIQLSAEAKKKTKAQIDAEKKELEKLKAEEKKKADAELAAEVERVKAEKTAPAKEAK